MLKQFKSLTMNNNQEHDTCSDCGVTQSYGTMTDVNGLTKGSFPSEFEGTTQEEYESEFHISCNACHRKTRQIVTSANPSLLYDRINNRSMNRINNMDTILEEKMETKLLYLSLHQMYEVDLDNCLMSTNEWILELAKAMTDPDYKEKFKKEYREYRKEVEA